MADERSPKPRDVMLQLDGENSFSEGQFEVKRGVASAVNVKIRHNRRDSEITLGLSHNGALRLMKELSEILLQLPK